MSEKIINWEDNNCVVLDFSEIYKLTNRINKKFEKLQRNIIQKQNITTAQYSILQQLWKTDGVPSKKLADACCCSQSTITGIVDTMVKNDIVFRKENPDDRRIQLVILTEKGKKLQSEAPKINSILDNCCGGFDPDDIDLLTILLNKLDKSFLDTELNSC